jgi:hypothetical protein
VISGAKNRKKNSFVNVRFPLLYCLLAFLCISCGKGGVAADELHAIDTSDTTYPVVEVTTPTDSQSFTSGSVINVTGKVSDNSLFQGSITIRNETDGLIVKDQYYEIHFIPSYNFSMSCTISVTATTDYTVTVKFEDHGFNKTTKTLKIKVNP